jgi:hypothetical protein
MFGSDQGRELIISRSLSVNFQPQEAVLLFERFVDKRWQPSDAFIPAEIAKDIKL